METWFYLKTHANDLGTLLVYSKFDAYLFRIALHYSKLVKIQQNDFCQIGNNEIKLWLHYFS